MKFSTPEVAWHNRDPIYSVDVQPCLQKGGKGESDWYRVATSGADASIIIWKIAQPAADQRPRIGQDNVLSLLTRHEKSVNVIRFVPTGDEMLASADVDGTIIIWKRGEVERITTTIIEPRKKNSSLVANSPERNGISVSQESNGCKDANGTHDSPFEHQNSEYGENWNQYKVLRGHIEDVVDICWSADGLFLVSGSVDNESIIWDVTKGTKVQMLSGHKSWVQGVSYDPLNDFIATISADRSLRIFSSQTKKVMYRVEKAQLAHGDDVIKTRLFYDYTMQSFTRRLSFSPAGEMLLVPSGVLEFPKPESKTQSSGVEVIEIDDENPAPATATSAPEVEMNYINVCHLFLRNNLQKPFAYLPTQDKFCHAVKFCPTRFRLHDGEENSFPFPYRIIFAIATQNSVLIYDTQHMRPFAFVSDIHYARLSDLAWSKDGRLLIVSSTDGFCTLISFEEHELGQVYDSEPYVFQAPSSTVDVEKEEKESVIRSPAPEPVVKVPKIGAFFTPISKEAKMERIQSELNSLKRKEQTPSKTVDDPVQDTVSPETKKPRILFANVQ